MKPSVIEEIQNIVADYFGITMEELKGLNKEAQFSHPRMMATFLIAEHTGFSTAALSRILERDKKTVLYGIAWVKRRHRLKTSVEELRKIIAGRQIGNGKEPGETSVDGASA